MCATHVQLGETMDALPREEPEVVAGPRARASAHRFHVDPTVAEDDLTKELSVHVRAAHSNAPIRPLDQDHFGDLAPRVDLRQRLHAFAEVSRYG